MVDDILRINHIRLSRRERQLLDKDLTDPNTNNPLARFVLQTIDRQRGFEQSRQMFSALGIR